MMGFNLDGLGNHNFDKGQLYLRNTLIALAAFPYSSANIEDSKREDACRVETSPLFGMTDPVGAQHRRAGQRFEKNCPCVPCPFP